MDKSTLSGCLVTMREALGLVQGLPPSISADCLPALSLVLAEASELQQLASWLNAHGPAEIAGITLSADECVLRHLSLALDSSGWPTVTSIDGPTVFTSSSASQILECARAALASATAPAVLLDTIPSSGWMRIEPADAGEVLRALIHN